MKPIQIDLSDDISAVPRVEDPDAENSAVKSEPAPDQNTYDSEQKLFKLPSVQKMHSVMFIMISVIIFFFAVRFISHIHKLNEYAIPEDAEISDEADTEDEGEDTTDYVNEVVYNPSKLGKAMAHAQNTYLTDGTDLMGEPLWYSGSSNYKWKFMSGFDYRAARIDCIWICKDTDTKEILAFHTATYNGANDSFEDGITKFTSEGESKLAVD